jgi:uncharacterized LabA/DUF88 family protein
VSDAVDNANLAVFCDFENIALGVRDAKIGDLKIAPILERLLLKGSIVAKKAYCDWDRYKEFKSAMHEAAFELVEIPHRGMTGKNSADIRMVVDALDLCYTKEHINTFVIVSGDSDFSPLVSKLRENAKLVIGVGVKNSTSTLLAGTCDEFIFYDDLVAKPPAKRRQSQKNVSSQKKTSKNNGATDQTADDVALEGIRLVLQTAAALKAERGDSGKVWGSMVKQTLKRTKPGFTESSYGFGSFSELLEEARDRKLISLELDEKSGGYTISEIVD